MVTFAFSTMNTTPAASLRTARPLLAARLARSKQRNPLQWLDSEVSSCFHHLNHFTSTHFHRVILLVSCDVDSMGFMFSASFQSNEAVRPGQLNQHHHNNPGGNHHGGYDHHHRGDNHSNHHHYCGHYNTCKHHCSHYSQHHRWNNYDYGLHDFGCDDCHDHGFGGVQETLWEVRGYELRWGNLLRAWLLVGGFKYIFRFDIVCGMMNQYLSPLGSLRLVVCVWWPLLLPVQDHHHHHALRVRLARTAERCPVSDPINLRPHTR